MDMLLVYLPWYLMENEITLGDYIITPFYLSKCSNAPFFSGYEEATRAILSNHLERPYTSNDRKEFPIKHGSIIRKKGDDFRYKFTQSEQDEIEILQYVLAIAGISNREYLHKNLYLCSENFKVFFQKFTYPFTPPFTPAIFTKKKDGSHGTAFSNGLFREIKPWHISKQELVSNSNYRLHFDGALAECIWCIYRNTAHRKIWEKHLYPSIFSFYLANTDGLSYQVELVYSASAIEKILAGSKFKTHEIVTELGNLITASTLNILFSNSTSRNWQSISYWKGHNKTPASNIIEAWIIELRSLRNNFAHGNAVNRASLIWTIEEHLLLSSIIFPLLLKMFIFNRNLCNGFAISSNDCRISFMGSHSISSNGYHPISFIGDRPISLIGDH